MRSMRPLFLAASLAATAATVFACSTTVKSRFDDPNANNDNGTVGGGTLGGGTGGSDGGKPCAPAAGNWDIPGNNCDDDNDGTVDNPPSCDVGLESSGEAEDFVRALGICATAAKDGYGLVSAKFTRGHGSSQTSRAEQHGILDKFGDVIKPREGVRLGVLSTGYAQEYDGAGKASFAPGKDWSSNGALPSGFPKAASGCAQADDVHDVIDLVLTLKAPKNASGVRFDFNFYSGEWPAYICSEFNDGFIAYLSAKGFNSGNPDNISFDKDKNPVSVNNGFFDRCTPNAAIGCAPGAKPGTSVCPGGVAELRGTGFGIDGPYCAIGGSGGTSTSGGATGWLTSSAPVAPGEEFTLEFLIWDTGDGNLDSSVLIDNFKWAEGEVTVETDRPR